MIPIIFKLANKMEAQNDDNQVFLNDYGYSEFNECENCGCHGFPCAECAISVYHGKLGPGFFNGERIQIRIFEHEIFTNMLNWQKKNRNVKIKYTGFTQEYKNPKPIGGAADALTKPTKIEKYERQKHQPRQPHQQRDKTIGCYTRSAAVRRLFDLD